MGGMYGGMGGMYGGMGMYGMGGMGMMGMGPQACPGGTSQHQLLPIPAIDPSQYD